MKWLRSSIFRNNQDQFIFKERVEIDIENFNTTIKSVENVYISGSLIRSSQDKILVDIEIKGDYRLISSRSLEEIVLPFEIEEREEFIDKSIVSDNDDIDVNVMDMFIDISNFVKELIIINAPSNYYLEDEQMTQVSGKDWKLVSSEDYIEEKKEDSPFSALNNLFKE